jgi:hypothetical protein
MRDANVLKRHAHGLCDDEKEGGRLVHAVCPARAQKSQKLSEDALQHKATNQA